MNINIKQILKASGFVLVALIFGITTATYAGSLTPPGTPAKTMYTLGNLYTLITTGTTSATTSFTTPGSVTPTFYSLTALVNAFASSTQTLSASTTTVPYGIYQATNLATVDTDLSASNIKSGTNIFGINGNYSGATSSPLKTGQTTCYNFAGTLISCSGTGQDGDLQKGTAISYVDNGDGTITDSSTGLVWQKQDDAVARSWQQSLTYCTANTAALPGSGWRLPNFRELSTLINYGTTSPAINSTYFPSTQSLKYWSSTTYKYPTYEYEAWTIFFLDGQTVAEFKTSTGYARCVRG